MTRKQLLAQNEAAVRARSAGSRASTRRPNSSRPALRKAQRKSVNEAASGQAKKKSFPLQNVNLAELYRPLKKPVTLRLDADVLAWFKKEGSRYQTRINSALRKVMEREMKEK
jgi:uncharacterized protein (DUF4415 family)